LLACLAADQSADFWCNQDYAVARTVTKREPMTKTEFLAALQAKNPTLTKHDLTGVLDSMAEVVTEGLKTAGEAAIPGIVKLKAVKKAAQAERQGINPFTKQAVTIAAKPESTKVKASPAKAIKDACA